MNNGATECADGSQTNINTQRLQEMLKQWRSISRIALRDSKFEAEEGNVPASRAILLKALAYKNCADDLEKVISQSTGQPPTPSESQTSTIPLPS